MATAEFLVNGEAIVIADVTWTTERESVQEDLSTSAPILGPFDVEVERGMKDRMLLAFATLEARHRLNEILERERLRKLYRRARREIEKLLGGRRVTRSMRRIINVGLAAGRKLQTMGRYRVSWSWGETWWVDEIRVEQEVEDGE